MKEKFRVELLEGVDKFLNGLDQKARKKIIYNMRKAQVVNDKELFSKLNKNIWEFRTLHSKTYYRLLAFWDKTGKSETIVVSTHGFSKKTGKTPPREIEKAERIMKQYFDAKK